MCPWTLVRSSILIALVASLPSLTTAQETPGFLTSRPLAAPKSAAPIKVGEEIATAAGQRRRVVLESGVTLFLNQNSKLKYAAKDEVNLSEGEAFIDVRGRRPDPAKASPLFTVKSARGTSEGRDAGWVVRTTVEQPGVAVIRGTVNVAPAEGKPQSVGAGSQLILGKEAAPMARASHVLDWARDLMLAAESPLVPGSEFAGRDQVGFEFRVESSHGKPSRDLISLKEHNNGRTGQRKGCEGEQFRTPRVRTAPMSERDHYDKTSRSPVFRHGCLGAGPDHGHEPVFRQFLRESRTFCTLFWGVSTGRSKAVLSVARNCVFHFISSQRIPPGEMKPRFRPHGGSQLPLTKSFAA